MTQDSEIRKLLAETIGLDTDSLGKRIINHAVSSHMAETGLRDFAGYIDLLRSDPEVLEQLIEKVVVTETWFFRDAEPFLYLSEYVRNIRRPAGEGPLRILSVPCSTGEEPFSIAMTLLDEGFAPGEGRWPQGIGMLTLRRCKSRRWSQGLSLNQLTKRTNCLTASS